jgi:hypothetical protein
MEAKSLVAVSACPPLLRTSYWLDLSKGMAGVKNILIIVNASVRNLFNSHQIPERLPTSWRWHGNFMAKPARRLTIH